MKQPKVSVIIPVYNTEKYLRRCLDSVINQTLNTVEIVVINDGSTDNSQKIIKEYVNKYPDRFIFIEKENGGQASARNIGLERCNGEYIGFLDSDDFIALNMFEKMYNMAKDNALDYVACGYTDICSQDGKDYVINDYVASKVCKCNKDMFFDALVSPFLHLYRASIIKESGVKFPEGVIYEDTAFYTNLIPYITKVGTIEESLAYRMRHSNSTMTTITASRVRNIFTVIKTIIDWYNEHNLNDYQMEQEYFCVRILLGSSMDRISKVNDANERKQIIIETFEFINKYFPNYKNNLYLSSSFKNRVIKALTKGNCGLYVQVLRIKNKFGRHYS